MKSVVLLAACAAAALVPCIATAQARGQTKRDAPSAVDPVTVRAEYAGVLLQSGRHAEAAREYSALLELDSTRVDWRLALARAYAWGERGREAEREVLRLIAESGRDTVLAELLRVARAAVDDPTVVELERWVADEPAWEPYRLALIRAHVRDQRFAAALPHYDTLLVQRRDPELLFARGQLYSWMDQLSPAAEDMRAAVALRSSADWHSALGDVWRWGGAWRRARESYANALALDPTHAGALAGLAQLQEAQRNALASGSDAPFTGWTSRSGWQEDNAGFLLLATRLGYGKAMGPSTVVAAGIEQRRVSHRSHDDVERWLMGWSADVAVSHVLGLVQLDARAGVTRHAMSGTTPVAQLGATALFGDVRVAASVTREPLYARLLSTRTLVEWSDGELVSAEPLEGRTVAASAAFPLADAQLWVAVERLRVSDGNERRGASLGVRYVATPSLTLLYSGGRLAFEGRSDVYWDPHRYTSHAVGAEYVWKRDEGLFGTIRALQGLGWSSEAMTLPSDSVIAFRSHRAPQLAVGGDATWRRDRWEVIARAAHTRGRAGGYQSLEGGLIVRFDWPRTRPGREPAKAPAP